MKNIIIIGSRGYQANYGGWETFVTNLIDNYKEDVTFHVAELTYNKLDDKKVIKKNNVNCIQIYTKDSGSSTMMLFAIKALKYINKYIKNNNLNDVFVYVLGCRMGPLYPGLIRPLKKNNVKVYLNPDGLEWTREKWNKLVKLYFKMSEHIMIKHSDKVICDSKAIKDYVDNKYAKYHKDTYFIAYGAYLDLKGVKTKTVEELFNTWDIKENKYYLIVSRFVPENNYKTIITEFMESNVKKDLLIIANIENNPYYDVLKNQTHFDTDPRIKFVGSFYEQKGLAYIRQNAYAYIHGHSAGGTNPSLLEAMANTKINILYDVTYNKEVGDKTALYFNKKDNNLSTLLNKVEKYDKKIIDKYGEIARDRIKERYTWSYIVKEYEKVFK